MRRAWATNLVIVSIGVMLFCIVNLRSGRIEANDGLGWDGRQYAHMVTGRLNDGTVPTQTRPLLPLLTRVPHAAGLDVIPAFQVVNLLAAAVLYFFLCRILDLHRVAAVYKAYFVATVALCIATAKMSAFYPTQIDLGALAIMSASTYVVLTRSGPVAGGAVLLAVTAREFGVALAFLGFHREVRQGRGVVRALFTYAPAVGAMLLLRQWANATNAGDHRPLISAAGYLANLALWRDPAFVAFFGYFSLTLLGGVTALFVLRPLWLARTLTATPELITGALIVVAAAVVGNADIWRYLVFLLPVLTVLFGVYVRDHQPRPMLLFAALLFTVVTQQPFSRMDMTSYFSQWFPAYVSGTDDATETFWFAWRNQFLVAGAGLAALGMLQRLRPTPSEAATATSANTES